MVFITFCGAHSVNFGGVCIKQRSKGMQDIKKRIGKSKYISPLNPWSYFSTRTWTARIHTTIGVCTCGHISHMYTENMMAMSWQQAEELVRLFNNMKKSKTENSVCECLTRLGVTWTIMATWTPKLWTRLWTANSLPIIWAVLAVS